MKKSKKLIRNLAIIFATVFAISSLGFAVTMLSSPNDTMPYLHISWGDFANITGTNLNNGEITEIDEIFSNVNIHGVSSNIVIAASDDEKTRIEFSHSNNLASLETIVQNDTLYVRERWRRGIQLFGINARVNMRIWLPKRQYDNIYLRLTSGSLATENFTLDSKNLNTRITSGRIEADVSVYENYTVRVTSGTVDLNGVSGNGEVRLTSGNVTLRYVKWNESFKANVTSGDLNIHLPENSGIRLNSRVTSGRIHYELGDDSGRIGTASGINFGGENIQTAELNLTSGRIRIMSVY
ncbi:MAG: DUF4097 domain-containing protein [Oscillospiraceae bacterium]|nr:DUF4097 domain-containing protein [Oscillospiraceae bacterium]